MKYPKVVPHLVVQDGLQAVKFYEEALGAKAGNVMMAEDGKRVMHAEVELNGGGVIFLCDEFPEYGSSTTSPKTAGNASVTMHLEQKKPKDVDAAMVRAAEYGAEITMPAADMFWGARYGRIRDPFGHIWSFGAPIKSKKGQQGANNP